MDVRFGEFLPDLSELGNPGATHAQNVIPHQGTYRPFPTLAIDSNALTARARGAIAVQDKTSTVVMFAGDATKLYRYAGGTWSDKSGATYTNATQDNWEFLKWGEYAIGTNYADVIQIGPLDGSSNFAALGGSPPKARHIGSVRGFVVLGNLKVGSTLYPNRVQWSGLEQETSWGTVPGTQADFQDLVGNGGRIQAITSGDIGVIFQERSIWTMEYVGPPLAFRFNEVQTEIGTPAPRSVVRYGNSIYYLSENGFQRYDVGGDTVPIGDKKIDLRFLERVNVDEYYRITAAIDVANAHVVWSYSNGASGPDELLIYDWKTAQWSYAVLDTECIFEGLSPGYTLEGLDSVNSSIDALPASLDSDLWRGGRLGLYGFDTAHKSGDFSGSALTARLETAEVASEDGTVLYCDNVRPLVQGSTATNTVYLATRNTLTTDHTYSSGVTQNSATGEHNLRDAARYMRFRVDIAGGFDHALGVRAKVKSGGVR